MDNNEINQIINDVYDSLERNNFSTLNRPEFPIWERPIIGVAAGDDSYYDFLKEHIGPFHWSPADAFQLKYPGPVAGEKLRVVSVVFLRTMETKQERPVRIKGRRIHVVQWQYGE